MPDERDCAAGPTLRPSLNPFHEPGIRAMSWDGAWAGGRCPLKSASSGFRRPFSWQTLPVQTPGVRLVPCFQTRIDAAALRPACCAIPIRKMRLILILLAGLRTAALAEDSYFFVFKNGGVGAEMRIEGDHLHTVRQIQKIDPPKTRQLIAFHQGLGSGRTYQIQIDLNDQLEDSWFPMLKLGEDLVTDCISVSYSNSERRPASISIEGDDPERIRKWSGILGTLLALPEERIEIDLDHSSQQQVDSSDGASNGTPRKAGDQEGQLAPDTVLSLNGESEWSLDQGPTISLRESKTDGFSFHDPAGNELFRLAKHEKVREVVKSPQRKIILFKISHEDGFGGCLLRLSLRGRQPKFERVLAYPATPLFDGKHWWVSDLGAVSDDGDVVLARLAWMPQSSGRVSYEWQTWSIARQKQLGSGLQIGNGTTQAPDQSRDDKPATPAN